MTSAPGAPPAPTITAVLVDAAGPAPPAALVGSGIEIVGRTATPAAAARLTLAHRPRLVVVDLDGAAAAISAIDAVVTAAPRTPVLALAAAPDHAAVLAAVRAGASSLVVPTGPAELAAAAARTVGGEAVFSPGLAEVVLAESARIDAAATADPQAGLGRFTERETDVLRLVVDGLTARQIATRLGLSPRTVENHVQNLLRRLRLPNRAALVRFAVRNGLA